MIARFGIIAVTFFIAIGILVVSILRVSSVRYSFSGKTNISSNRPAFSFELGSVEPDSPFWVAKASWDKFALAIQTDPLAKAERLLYLADQRLSSAKRFFENGNDNLAVAVLVKAEMYLVQAAEQEGIARDSGRDTKVFLKKLTDSSFTHQSTIEGLLRLCSEQACPILVKSASHPKRLYEQAHNTLISLGNNN